MTPELSTRLLVALFVSIVLGFMIRHGAKARLDQWSMDPAAAQRKAIERLKLVASGQVFLGSAMLCIGTTLVVEIVVSLFRGSP